MCIRDSLEEDMSIPVWENVHCSLVGYTLESDTLFFEADACLKIINNFQVIDWCNYDPSDPDLPGLYAFTNVVSYQNTEEPTLESPLDFTFNCIGGELSYGIIATSECDSERLQWEVLLDIDSDFSDDYEWSSFIEADAADALWDDDNGNGIPDVRVGNSGGVDNLSVPYTTSGREYAINLTEDILASIQGTARITWKVYDGCGNVSASSVNLTFNNSSSQDQSPPIPFCVNLDTVSANADFSAIDFDRGSFDNCTFASNLRFTFSDVSPENDPNFSGNSSVMQLTGSGLQTVTIYVWDLSLIHI